MSLLTLIMRTKIVTLCFILAGSCSVVYFLTSVFRASSTTTMSQTTAATMALLSADFEVYGRVQGVFFRKHTKQEADKLGLRGWCQNTSQGTVLGHLQGPSEKVEQMMNWLRTTGSPSSLIEKAEFRNQKSIAEYTFEDFSIRKD